ncbi:Precorrin isomerase [[Clostridium] cf. saccharolyticum K10]|nr:Precorrin isomerase [[Clostridium] cf. saccharolyticum K10]
MPQRRTEPEKSRQKGEKKSMKTKLEQILPGKIEERSFEIIKQELKTLFPEKVFLPEEEPVVRRVIHTTADFDYAENLVFSEGAVKKGLEALKNGAVIVTDTNMGKAGINKKSLKKLGSEVFCFMADEDVALAAKRQGTTRAAASMDKAASLEKDCIFAVGNAPTALVRLCELIEEKKIAPKLIIGVPVGFVNVVQSKEMILSLKDVPYIVARGRKGGSNVAAAICNALIYQLARER